MAIQILMQRPEIAEVPGEGVESIEPKFGGWHLFLPFLEISLDGL